MERTEILSLFKNTPADGTEITVCGCSLPSRRR